MTICLLIPVIRFDHLNVKNLEGQLSYPDFVAIATGKLCVWLLLMLTVTHAAMCATMLLSGMLALNRAAAVQCTSIYKYFPQQRQAVEACAFCSS